MLAQLSHALLVKLVVVFFSSTFLSIIVGGGAYLSNKDEIIKIQEDKAKIGKMLVDCIKTKRASTIEVVPQKGKTTEEMRKEFMGK